MPHYTILSVAVGRVSHLNLVLQERNCDLDLILYVSVPLVVVDWLRCVLNIGLWVSAFHHNLTTERRRTKWELCWLLHLDSVFAVSVRVANYNVGGGVLIKQFRGLDSVLDRFRSALGRLTTLLIEVFGSD